MLEEKNALKRMVINTGLVRKEYFMFHAPDSKKQDRQKGSTKLNQTRKITHQFVVSVGGLTVKIKKRGGGGRGRKERRLFSA